MSNQIQATLLSLEACVKSLGPTVLDRQMLRAHPLKTQSARIVCVSKPVFLNLGNWKMGGLQLDNWKRAELQSTHLPVVQVGKD